MSRYLPGDTLSRRKGLVRHTGVALGDGRVLHNLPGRGEHISSEAAFGNGQQVQVQRRSRAQRERALAGARRYDLAHNYGYSQANPRRYHLLSNNCEHTVHRVSSGRARSPQLRGWLAGLGLAGAALLVTRHPGLAAAGFVAGKTWGERSGR